MSRKYDGIGYIAAWIGCRSIFRRRPGKLWVTSGKIPQTGKSGEPRGVLVAIPCSFSFEIEIRCTQFGGGSVAMLGVEYYIDC
jgi:hypothetical protein